MLKILSRYVSLKTLLLLVSEVFWITGAMILLTNLYARYVRHWGPGSVDIPHIALRVALITLICQVSLYYNDLYDLSVVNSRQEILIRILQSFGATCLVLFALFWIFPKLVIGSSNLVAAAVAVGVLLLLGWRILIMGVYRYYDRPSRVVILGAGELALDLVRAIEARSDLNMKVMGLVGAEPGEEVNPELEQHGLRMLGTIEDLETLSRQHKVNGVAVGWPARRDKLPVRALLNLKLQGVEIDDAWSLYEKVAGK